jgi:UDP-glucose 4-epimerase
LKVIYYLAHVNTPVNSDLDLPNDALLNLVPLLNLLDAIQSLGGNPHVVYFSSGGAVYPPTQNRIPYREEDPCSPRSSYGILKLTAEDYLRLAASKGYLTATVLRVGNAYGTLLSQHRMQGLIGVTISRILHGHPLRIFGSLDNVRDYVHLEDICSMAARASIPRREFSIVNVGSGQGHSVTEVLRVIEECYGGPLNIQHDESCGNELADWVVLDNTKAAREFGWYPAIDLRSGIERTQAGWHAPSAAAGIR